MNACLQQAQKEAGVGSYSCGGTSLIYIYYQPENDDWTLGRTCQWHGAGGEAAGQHRPPMLLSGTGLQSKGLPSPASGTWQDPWLAVLGLVAGFLRFSAWQELEQLGKLLQGL